MPFISFEILACKEVSMYSLLDIQGLTSARSTDESLPFWLLPDDYFHNDSKISAAAKQKRRHHNRRERKGLTTGAPSKGYLH